MLPKSRIWSALVLGLGVALLAAGISAGSILNFSPKLPLDAQNTTWTLHDDHGRALVIGGQSDDTPDTEASARAAAQEIPEGEEPGKEDPAGEHPAEGQADDAQPAEEPAGDGGPHQSDAPKPDAPQPEEPDIYEGPVTYQVHMDIGEQSTARNADLRIGETTVRSDNPEAKQNVDNLYNARVWSYTIDRETGEAKGPAKLTHTIAMPGDNVDVDGYWLKFPAHAEKTNYPVFDSTLRESREAVFAEEMDIDGRTVYRYHQDIEPENVAQKYAGMLNTTSLPSEDGGTEQGYLFHSAKNDYYVDQETGMLVGMNVDVDDYYGNADGKRAYDALRFKGSTSEEDRSAFLAQAEDFPDQTAARIVRWVVIGVGTLLSLLGLAGVLGLFGRRKDETESSAQPDHLARPVGR